MAPSSSNTSDSPPGTPRGALTSLTLPSTSSSSFPVPVLDSEDPPPQAPNEYLQLLPPRLRRETEAMISQVVQMINLNISGSSDIPELQARRHKEHRIPVEGGGAIRLRLREMNDNDDQEYEERIEEREGKKVRVQVKRMALHLGFAGAAVEKLAAAELTNLDLSGHIQDGEHATAQVQGHRQTEDANGDGNADTHMNMDTDTGTHEYTDTGGGKGKGKGKAVAEPAELAGSEVEAEAGDGDAALTRGVHASRTQDNSRHGESSYSGGSNEPDIVQYQPDDTPIPDLWPAPIPADEAALLNLEDRWGPLMDDTSSKLSISEAQSFLLSTPPTSPHYPVAHHLVSTAFREDFRRTSDTCSLADAFRHARIAVSLLAPPRIIRSMAIINLAEIHNLSWLRTKNLSDISAAVELFSRSLGVVAGNDPIRIPITRFLSQMHSQRYDALRKPEDLERSIVLAEEMTAMESARCKVHGSGMSDIEMASAHLELGQRLYDLGDIDKSIERFELAMALSGEDADLHAHALAALVMAMQLRNPNDHAGILTVLRNEIKTLPESHPRIQDLRRSIETLADTDRVEALRAVIDNGDGEVETLADLAGALFRRSKKRGNMEDLDNCIEPAEIALAATEHTEKAYVIRCELLAQALGVRYLMRGDRADIDWCIETWEKALDVAEGEALLYVQTNMSNALYARHKHGSGAADIDRALQLAKAASVATGRDHSEYAGRLLNLGNTYMGRFRVYGTKADIDTGISTLRRALEASEDEGSSVDGPGLMGNLAIQLLARYETFRQPSDIAEAAEYAEKSMNCTPGGTQFRLERGLNLATILEIRSHKGDLERSVYLTRSALADIPKGHRIIPGTMMVLADRIKRLYGKAEEGLNAAVAAMERAAAAAKVGHPDRATVLAGLAVAYRVRYERMGNIKDLERAVKNSYASVASGEDMTAMKGESLSILSELLAIRHRRTGAMEDLDLAVKSAREALDCTPLEHQSRPQRLIELSERLLERYKTCDNREDLLTAITMGELCLEKTLDKEVNLCRRLYILAEALHCLHCISESYSFNLDRARELAHTAWSLFETDRRRNITQPEIAHLIGRLLRSTYRHDRNISTINEAILYLERAATLIDDEHPNRAEILDTLARCYLIRYQALGTGTDGERSFVTFRDAWESPTAPPLTRIRAAKRVCDALTKSKRWDEAADIFEECVKLMPRVTPPSLARKDQEALIKMLSGVPLIAAGTALEAGRGAEQALRLLELGRGMIRGFTMDCRSDISDLQAAHPELYQEFDSLRRELDSAVQVPQDREGLPKQLAYVGEGGLLARRKEAVEELEESLVKIRSLEGFDNFLLPPTGEELRQMAAEGPIVVFNSWMEQCQAILVTTENISSVQLPRWKKDDAEKHIWDLTNKYVRGSMRTYQERSKNVKTTMRWLWNVVVKPVLNELGFTKAVSGGGDGDGGVFPQIWWVGSGPLSFAPFHAAGSHTPSSTENTISRVISSYIPSIKALTYARQKRPVTSTTTSPPSILIIKMPTTPDHSDLPGVNKEVTHIESLVGSNTVKTLTHPTASEALEHISSHRAVHFACHGITDRINPSNGALLLRKKDGSQDRLTVQMVADTRMEAAQIAYLSACSTAQNTVQELADETIHLAGAFMLAGFRNVVATMWEGNDEACAMVAGEYYRGLFVEGLGSGEAVHRAVVKLRRKKPEMFLKWAPFIHTGA